MMKTLKAVSLCSLCSLLFHLAAVAQQPGLKQIVATNSLARVLALSTNVIATGLAATNTFSLPGAAGFGVPGNPNCLQQDVHDYDYAGFTWAYSAGSNATVQVWRSYDYGSTFTLGWSFSGPVAAATAWATNALLDTHGVTTLGFVDQNPSTLDQTNAAIEIFLKMGRVQARLAPN